MTVTARDLMDRIDRHPDRLEHISLESGPSLPVLSGPPGRPSLSVFWFPVGGPIHDRRVYAPTERPFSSSPSPRWPRRIGTTARRSFGGSTRSANARRGAGHLSARGSRERARPRVLKLLRTMRGILATEGSHNRLPGIDAALAALEQPPPREP